MITPSRCPLSAAATRLHKTIYIYWSGDIPGLEPCSNFKRRYQGKVPRLDYDSGIFDTSVHQRNQIIQTNAFYEVFFIRLKTKIDYLQQSQQTNKTIVEPSKNATDNSSRPSAHYFRATPTHTLVYHFCTNFFTCFYCLCI